MGLDITAYKNIKRAAEGSGLDGDGYADYENGFFFLYLNPDFPGRANDIEAQIPYESEQSMGFRAGGYSGYNQWRDELAKLACYPATPYTMYGATTTRHDAGAWDASEGPFWELINFSDSEGTIGTAVSKKLAKDFADFQAKADLHPDEYFRARYNEWREAFDMAADNGAVSFH